MTTAISRSNDQPGTASCLAALGKSEVGHDVAIRADLLADPGSQACDVPNDGTATVSPQSRQ